MDLPHHLFWDIDLNSLDTNKHTRFIIQRVIQRGSLDDWTEIKGYYGLDLIKREILLMRTLDPKTLNFFSIYFDISKEKFRCFSTQQSTPQHFSY